MTSTSGCVCTNSRVSFLSVSRRFSRASTASANRASRSAACAMRVQFAHLPQKSGRPSVVVGVQTIHRLRQHQRQRVLARSLPARQHDRMRKMLARQHVAQPMDNFGIAVKIRKA